MPFNIGDLVTRNSYNNDTVFKIIDIDSGIAILKGVNIRLFADSDISDLKKVEVNSDINDDKVFLDRFQIDLNRNEFFYLPGKVVHIDGDEEYLERCMDFYKKVHVKAIGIRIKEDEISSNIKHLLEEYNPDILVITGHDGMLRRGAKYHDIYNYRNSKYFIETVKEARKYDKEKQKNLVIFAGACQSYFEALISAGANFASSPARILIDFLDPLLVAEKIATTEKYKYITIDDIAYELRDGKDGVSGIGANGKLKKLI